jgi:hypothetical protein
VRGQPPGGTILWHNYRPRGGGAPNSRADKQQNINRRRGFEINASGFGYHNKKSRTIASGFSSLKKKALRHRQKIFTTNNHYEWSKLPVMPDMPYLK